LTASRPPLTAAQRTLRARLAAYSSWANTDDRAARTKAGHRASPASVGYWLERVDPDGTLTDESRHAKARAKRDACMARLAFNRSRAQQRKAAAESVPDEAA
jgi:hypothetical protein